MTFPVGHGQVRLSASSASSERGIAATQAGPASRQAVAATSDGTLLSGLTDAGPEPKYDPEHAMTRGLAIASWVCLGAAVLVIVTAFLGRWAVNAEGFGAHDLGLAVFLAFLSNVALISAIWSAPVFVLAGLLAQRVNHKAGLRLMAAGALNAVPLVGYTWL